jgi:N-acetylglucosamine-6-phosphate deacetylase
MVTKAEVPLLNAVRMITRTPASILGIADRKGSLVAGLDADIVIFDEQIRVQKTIVGGRLIYDRSSD